MLERLREPGGTLGNLSLASAVLLAVVGAAGAISMVVSLATDSSWWSDDPGGKWIGLVFFLVTFAGAAGFALMDRNPWLGAGLAAVGGVAMGMILWWSIIAAVLGVGVVVVAAMRARAMHGHAHPTAAAV